MYYNVHILNSFRRTLDDKSASILVHAFVLSRLDIGNGLLFNISKQNLNKLQHALNAAARVLSKTFKFDHISPVLKKLHWLPVQERIQFKIILLTWKVLHGLAPGYLNELIPHYIPQRSLRSSKKYLLVTPRTHTSYGNRAFSYAAPTLWNTLPIAIHTASSLDTFKLQLKTYLFPKSR